jgi:hypothetical protein
MDAIVHAADIQDRDGGVLLMATLFGLYPFLLKLYADAGYQGPKFQQGLARVCREVNVECSAAIWTGKSVNQDWKVQSRQMMIDAARQENKCFLIPSRGSQDGVLIDARVGGRPGPDFLSIAARRLKLSTFISKMVAWCTNLSTAAKVIAWSGKIRPHSPKG